MKLLKQIETLFRAGTSGGLSDAELLERFVQLRDEAAESAFAALVDRHGAMVLRVCRQVLADDHDAEDAAQATFLVLARRADSIGRRASVASWLHGVALRVAAKARVAAARRRKHEERGGMMRTDSHVVEHDLERIDDSERWAKLHDELARLPDAFRQPLVLCYLEGLTQEQAADLLRCPVGTIQSRLARGRAKLQVRLEERGVDFSPCFAAGVLHAPNAATPPSAWAETTVRHALRFAHYNGTGIAGAGAASAALAEDVLRVLFWTEIRAAAGVLLSVALLVSAAAGWAMQQREAPPSVTAQNPPLRGEQPEPRPATGNDDGRIATVKRVVGIVRDENGRPMAGAWVGRFIYRVHPVKIIVFDAIALWDDVRDSGDFVSKRWEMLPFSRGAGLADRTGSDGRFDVSVPISAPRGAAELHVASPDFRRQALRIARAGDPEDALEITLRPAPFVSAHVSETPADHPKEPFVWAVYALDVPGAELEYIEAIRTKGALWARGSWSRITTAGSYAIDRRLGVNLPAGRYRVRLRSKTFDHLMDISVPAGDTALGLPEMTLASQASITPNRTPADDDGGERWDVPPVVHGKVAGRNGQPLAGARVSVYPPALEHEIKTDSGGSFAFTVDKPGRDYFSIRVDAEGMATNVFDCRPSPTNVLSALGSVAVRVRPPRDLIKPLLLSEGITVTGRVVREGVPVAGVLIALHHPQRGLFGGNPWEIRTDEKGLCRFAHVVSAASFTARGRLRSVGNDECVFPRQFHTCHDGTDVNLGDLEVRSGRTLAGRLISSDGQALRGPINLKLTTPGADGEIVAVVNGSGRFAFTGLPEGPVLITMFFENGGAASYRFSSKNKCLNPRVPVWLEGRLDHDITDLTILLQRGKAPRLDIPIHPLPEVDAAFNAAKFGPITGVRPGDYLSR
jgi:RNA polymerase sigma factor (sigma-70 family)